MSSFLNLKTTRLGTKAEVIGSEFIQSKGYVPYAPAIDCPHPIDYIAMSGASQFYLDVKTKSRMLYYPFTGIDLKDANKYMEMKIPVYLLFVDPASCSVYGQWMSKLDKQPTKIFPGNENREKVVTWPLSAMTFHRYLSESECDELKKLEQSNYR